ncbi:MAG: hypothetical protein ACTS82_00675 [Arsenophonus sp. ET-DL12-MAG3]
MLLRRRFETNITNQIQLIFKTFKWSFQCFGSNTLLRKCFR